MSIGDLIFGYAIGRGEPESISSSMAMSKSAEASRKATSTERRIRMMEEYLDRSFLIHEALWELLRDKAGLKLDDLENKLYEIDMRDGELDGKNQRKSVECKNCKRTVSARHAACIYCGEIVDDSIFAMSK